MSRFLVDTDILIDVLRGREWAKDYLHEKVEEATLYCSVITVAEVYAGMRENERDRTITLIEGFFILPVTLKVAEEAARFKREAKSHSLELDDCMIAATAHTEKAVLATKNRKHYPMKEVQIESPVIEPGS